MVSCDASQAGTSTTWDARGNGRGAAAAEACPLARREAIVAPTIAPTVPNVWSGRVLPVLIGGNIRAHSELAVRVFIREGCLSAGRCDMPRTTVGERPGLAGLAQALRPRIGNRRFVRLVHRAGYILAVDVGGRTSRFQLAGR